MTGLFISLDDYLDDPDEGREVTQDDEYIYISSISNIPGWEERLATIERMTNRPRINGTFAKMPPTASRPKVFD